MFCFSHRAFQPDAFFFIWKCRNFFYITTIIYAVLAVHHCIEKKNKNKFGNYVYYAYLCINKRNKL